MEYRIRIQGHLDPVWQTWFFGMQIEYEAAGTTVLVGELPDQAALYGALLKIQRLGLPLLGLESNGVGTGLSGMISRSAGDRERRTRVTLLRILEKERTMNNKFMNIGLWVLQLLLAVAFFAHGWLFLAPPTEMAAQMNALIPPSLRIFIGAAEVLAAIGLVLPGLTRILSWLTALAAAGLMIVMASATVFHLYRGEISSALSVLVLLALLTFVAYMRWKVKPILPRAAMKRSGAVAQ